ncbi:MAG: methionyl-tRNA formyltransferase [Bacteroidota bacterium]
MSKDLRIIFLGTPDFAAASLKKLVENDINIVAVITAPDRPKGRGKKLGTSAVKDYAIEAGLTVLQPTNLKSPEFIDELKSYKADLQIVVAFRMMPEVVWNMPPLGTFNLHASLLPQYRGAAPINWAIINGEQETGVTTFFLKHEIDTGEIIFQETEPIKENDNVGSLYQRLMNKGADLVLRTVKAIESDDYPQEAQQGSSELKTAPKIFKEDCKIDWSQNANQIRDFVRGLSPYPAAWARFEGKMLKVYEVERSTQNTGGSLGEIKVVGKNRLLVNVANGTMSILDLQIEGKRRMKVDEFLRGYQPLA